MYRDGRCCFDVFLNLDYLLPVFHTHRHTPMYTCKYIIWYLVSTDGWRYLTSQQNNCLHVLLEYTKVSNMLFPGCCAFRTPERWSSWNWPRVASWVNTWRRQGRWRKRRPKAGRSPGQTHGGVFDHFGCLNQKWTCQYRWWNILSLIIMEVENHPNWKETKIGGTHFPLSWLWEKGTVSISILKFVTLDFSHLTMAFNLLGAMNVRHLQTGALGYPAHALQECASPWLEVWQHPVPRSFTFVTLAGIWNGCLCSISCSFLSCSAVFPFGRKWIGSWDLLRCTIFSDSFSSKVFTANKTSENNPGLLQAVTLDPWLGW